MATFSARTSEPGAGNLWYQRYTYGGYNYCILGNSAGRKYSGCVLPNCTGYAYGRWMECQGYTSCNLSTSNANQWYWHTSDGYYRSSSVPYLGAVICWGSRPGNNYGHVAIVEKIYSNTDIVWTESNWSGTAGNGRYWRTVRGNPANYASSALSFQGYIYPTTTWDGEDPTPDPDPSDPDDFEPSGWYYANWLLHRKKHKGRSKLIV